MISEKQEIVAQFGVLEQKCNVGTLQVRDCGSPQSQVLRDEALKQEGSLVLKAPDAFLRWQTLHTHGQRVTKHTCHGPRDAAL